MTTFHRLMTLALVGIGLGMVACSPAQQALTYEKATIGRGSIRSMVASTGTLAVVSSVSVLSQMSGRVEKVLVDYNDRVKKGQVLAILNTELLKLQAKAAQAGVDKAQANYDLQALAVQNSQTLAAKGLLSDYDLKTSQSNLHVNKADLASAQASLDEIETQINQYAFITSPLDGIILERDIDPGESVLGGSSSTSTSLFTIAQDLNHMQIKAEVDELDIGAIHPGQEVEFTVEANPGQSFQGTVKEVRLVPETSSNVVYYYVIILADNPSGKLLPGMTASVNFIKEKKENIVMVPSAALRFTPSTLTAAEVKKAVFVAGLDWLPQADREAALKRYEDAEKAPVSSKLSQGGLTSLLGGAAGGPGGAMGGPPGGGMGGPPGGGLGGPPGGGPGPGNDGKKFGGPVAPPVRKVLWTQTEAGTWTALSVRVGVSDSLNTELVDADGLEGRSVVVKVKTQ